MKIGIKKKDFLDKGSLQGLLETKLKKPVNALKTGKIDRLPFCYEVDLFDDGSGFLCIGEAKEIQQLYKTKRVKGQGQDEQGKLVKIDKKKVAYGTVRLNDEGAFEFCVVGGLMKPKDVKAVIKSIGILKKTIGENFIITKGLPQDKPVEPTTKPEEETTSASDNNTDPNKTARQAKLNTIQQNISKIQSAVGVADAQKIRDNLNKYKKALEQLVKQAKKDGQVDKEEQKQIDQLSTTIDQLEKQLDQLGDRKTKLTPKRKEKIKQNMTKINDRLNSILTQLGL